MLRGQCRKEQSKISVNFLVHVVETLSDGLLQVSNFLIHIRKKFIDVLLVVIDLLLDSQISFPEESKLIVLVCCVQVAMDADYLHVIGVMLQ